MTNPCRAYSASAASLSSEVSSSARRALALAGHVQRQGHQGVGHAAAARLGSTNTSSIQQSGAAVQSEWRKRSWA